MGKKIVIAILAGILVVLITQTMDADPDAGLIAGQARVSLRSTPATLSENEVQEMLKRRGFYDNTLNRAGHFANEYESRTIYGNQVVLDHATGLMWFQSGEGMGIRYLERWIEELNWRGYAGCHDWRLPTVEEAASLLENKKSNGDLYIDAKFSVGLARIWTCDDVGDRPGHKWVVNFREGSVHGSQVPHDFLPVRSGLTVPEIKPPVPPANLCTKSVDVKGVKVELVWVPAGEFMVGDDEGYNTFRHKVKISRGFWMGKYEVTQGLWMKVMGGNPSAVKSGENYPVESVSWMDCQDFLRKLNALTGGKFRLPTEAEWEYACRAGTEGRFFWGMDPSLACQYANVSDLSRYREYPYLQVRIKNSPRKEFDCEDGYVESAPVGSFKPNAFGLHDMLGNVAEWCSDWAYRSYKDTPSVDPQGPSKGERRVVRGSSCGSGAVGGTCSWRWSDPPSRRNRYTGFRLAEDE